MPLRQGGGRAGLANRQQRKPASSKAALHARHRSGHDATDTKKAPFGAVAPLFYQVAKPGHRLCGDAMIVLVVFGASKWPASLQSNEMRWLNDRETV